MKKLIIFLLLLLSPQIVNAQTLTASWYSKADLIRDGQDKKTHFIMANGKEFNENAYTCASWDYPIGTWLIVRVLDIRGVDNGQIDRQVIVQVTDRTARRFKGKRIDLSKGAFSKIADCKQGIVSVKVTKL